MKILKGPEEEEALTYLKMCAKIAERALCLRAKCGSVIVKDHKVIGEGYNAPPLDDPKQRTCLDTYPAEQRKPKFDRTCCMHAEWRAILDALRRNPEKIKGSRLYFGRWNEPVRKIYTEKPYCTVCSRLALDTGIAEFVLWREEGVCVWPTDEYNQVSYEYHRA